MEKDASFRRDPNSGALINFNTEAHQRFLQERRNAKMVKDLKTEIDSMKSEFEEIRRMITVGRATI